MCFVILVKWHPFIKTLEEFYVPTRKEKKKNKNKEKGRKEEVNKERKLQLAGEKEVTFSTYRLCFATNGTVSSKSISQRLRKVVRRE